MKKIIIASIAFSSIKSTLQAQIYFGINGGINMSNLKTTVNGKDDGFKGSIGYIGAADVNIPVGTNLLLQTGLQYESYHTKLNVTNTGTDYTETINGKTHVEFISVPLKLLYQMPSGNNVFSVGGGVYAGIGVSGHTNGSTYSQTDYGGDFIVKDTSVIDQSLQFGSAVGQIKQLNIGINVSAA